MKRIVLIVLIFFLASCEVASEEVMVPPVIEEIPEVVEQPIESEVIVENTALIIYEYTDSFYGEQLTEYEDIYKELYPDSDDYWDHDSGYYSETKEYDKKKGKQWSESRHLEMY